MKLKEALLFGAHELGCSVESPAKESRILLSFLTGFTHVEMMLKDNTEINQEKFFQLLEKRKDKVPIEYITGSASFYSRNFFVDSGSLIPRPETEILVDKVLDILDKDMSILDVGCGSGIIAITLALESRASISAVDISENALNISRVNAKRFGVDIDFNISDLLNSVERKYDIIVSNPPYIADDFILDKGLDYEPQNALFGGKVGDEILKRLIDESLVHGAKYLCFEMGYDQKKPLSDYMDKKDIKAYTFYTDLAGFDRGCIVKLRS